jgi:hypothetical protein
MLPSSTYPTWYNVIPPFVPLDINLYLTYPIKTNGLEASIFRNYKSYVHGYVYPILEQLVVPTIYTSHFVGNQFPIMVQLVTNIDRQLV